jgi:hypothetical membrane protein
LTVSTDVKAPNRRIAVHRRLAAGALAGPLFVVASFIQMPLSDGFDISRHAFSFLLNGPGGWIQTCNFVVTGALFLYAASGVSKALEGKAGTVVGILVRVLGAGLIVAGLFAPQPSYGYPPSAPLGMPDHLTMASVVHGIAFTVSVFAYCAALAVTSWRLSGLGDRLWAGLSAAAALALLAVPPTQASSIGPTVI